MFKIGTLVDIDTPDIIDTGVVTSEKMTFGDTEAVHVQVAGVRSPILIETKYLSVKHPAVPVSPLLQEALNAIATMTGAPRASVAA